MLITQKMDSVHLSENEKQIRKYILEHEEESAALTVKELSGKIFVSPASLVVFAKKLGFSGWNEFRQAFQEEQNYRESHFKNIDANVPFTATDSIMKIANKVATLQQETIADTVALLRQDRLRKAVQFLRETVTLHLYGTSMSYMAAEEFAYSMKRIGKPVEFCMYQSEQTFQAKTIQPDSCALIVSYTGETAHAIEVCRILKEKGIPIITLTGIGENTLKQYSDVCLEMSTRENVHSKISTFTTRQSIHTVLDILYSCYFATAYEENYEAVLEMNRELEKTRFSTNREINK